MVMTCTTPKTRYLCAGLFILAACSDTPTAPAATARTSPTMASRSAFTELLSAQQGRISRGFEDDILRLEARVPGVGGVYLDTLSGDFIVYLQDTTARALAISEFRQLAAQFVLDEPIRQRLASGGGVSVRQGQYRFSQLVAWQTALVPSVLRLPGVIAIDADESRNRVVVSLQDNGPRDAVDAVVSKSGLPEGSVLTTLGIPAFSANSTRGTFRPYGGGLQIANDDASLCTLGFNVTTSSGQTGFLTGAHCAAGAEGAGVTGGSIYQPLASAGTIGTIALNPLWNQPLCGQTLCTKADVLFAQATNASQALKRVVITEFVGQNSAGGSITTIGWWTNLPNGYVTIPMGLALAKRGSTTGWTRGTVSRTCQAEDIGVGTATPYTVLCANRVSNARVGEGDSGSPVFQLPTGGGSSTLWPAGILFAGTNFTAEDRSDPNYVIHYCTSNCEFLFSAFGAINDHLGVTVNPLP